MKNIKHQRVRLRISHAGETVRFNATCDKDYKNLKAILVNVPNNDYKIGSMLGFRLNNVEVLDDGHLVANLGASDNVAPNNKFYFFEHLIKANGAAIEGRFTDGAKYPLLVDNGDDTGVFDAGKVDFKNLPGYTQNPKGLVFPYDVTITFLLVN